MSDDDSHKALISNLHFISQSAYQNQFHKLFEKVQKELEEARMFIDMQNDRLIKARSHAIHDCLDQIISIRNFAPKDAVPCLDAIIDILKRTAASADLPRKI